MAQKKRAKTRTPKKVASAVSRMHAIAEQAERELDQEITERAKGVLVERLKEIRAAKLVLQKLEDQYQELLDKDPAELAIFGDGTDIEG